ncbi:MAG: hypothetical protein OEZ06_14545 [Myxococcales bacterium]|nr:hypothetical protein [Myxococcales bacterium]
MLALLLLAACSGEPAPPAASERQRALLDAPRREEALKEKVAAQKLFDAQGKLLPSGETVAELPIPRGMLLIKSGKYEWVYQSERVGIEALTDYLGPRLFTGNVDRRSDGSTTYVAARIKEKPKAPPVTVRAARLSGARHASRLHIRQAAPVEKPALSREQAEELLRERRAYAD